jgi:transposase
MAKHRTHNVEFKRQVSQEYLSGGTLHGLSKRHNVSRNLIRIWVDKFQAGALDEDVASADLLETYEARIAALERLVGKQALELDFLKGVQRSTRRHRRPSPTRRGWRSNSPSRRHGSCVTARCCECDCRRSAARIPRPFPKLAIWPDGYYMISHRL